MCDMTKILFFFFAATLLVVSPARGQVNARRSLSPSLRECYKDPFLHERDNRLPHTLNSLLAILRKIENTKIPNLNLQTLSVAILHRFRQDGIVSNPNVPAQDGVTPFAPNGFQFFKQAQTLRFIPGNAVLFPNNSLTAIERCTLHFMISSSIEDNHRGDESKVCRFASAYRRPRSVEHREDSTSPESSKNDVETLSPDEIEQITKHREPAKTTVDPNSLYPEYPFHHPHNSQISSAPLSNCPVENGVVKTPWGAISAGLVIAGIAAGLLSENVTLRELQSSQTKKSDFPSDLYVDNRWLVTLAGDLAEVALMQGPQQMDPQIGTNGNWNSTALPRWYFLNNNEDVEYTLAEVRGGLDGLILSHVVNKWFTQVPSLKLSQVLDLYYSQRGFYDQEYRACNRRTMLTSVAPNSTTSAQAYSASLVLYTDLTEVTVNLDVIKKFATKAASGLLTFIPSKMNNDPTCTEADTTNDFNRLSVDLTIVLDTNWPFESVIPVLAYLLDHMEINQYNSNFTMINGYDGAIMIDSTYDILELFSFNSSNYKNFSTGFDLPRTLEKLNTMQMQKLNNERDRGIGGGRSSVMLIVPYLSPFPNSDKEYCLHTVNRMREVIPDLTLLIATYGSKDSWSEFVLNPGTDLFTITYGDTQEALAPLESIVSRIKKVPKRLINSQCGADYNSQGASSSFDDYVEPNSRNFYRLHPNYFYNSDTTYVPKVKIQTFGMETLTVCTSRESLDVTTQNKGSCTEVRNDVHTIHLSCGDAYYIHQCQPLYVSVSTNTTKPSHLCTDSQVCRFSYNTKYTFSYENLVCVSSGRNLISNFTTLFILASCILFFNQ